MTKKEGADGVNPVGLEPTPYFTRTCRHLEACCSPGRDR
jgi:hypothetical protein